MSGRTIIQNFSQMVADLGALPAGSGPLSIGFPAGGSSSLPLLSDALAGDDAQAAQAMTMPNTPSSNAQFEAARQLYAKNVMADALSYLDTQVLPIVSASPTLSQRAKAWFSEKVEHAAAAAGGFMTEWRAAVDWIGRAIGVVLTRMVAFFFTAATGALIEIELFMLVLAMPLWLLPATQGAFHGVLRSLVALSMAVPAYQFIMLLVDALMGLVLKYIMFGPLAAGSTGTVGAAAGVGYMVAAAVATVGSGGEMVALVMFCYMIAYIFLAIYMAIKTPRLIALFLKGAGAAGAFLSAFATGLVAGAATALSTAAVAGGAGSFAGRWLGAHPGSGSAGVSPGFRPSSARHDGAARASAHGGTSSVAAPMGRFKFASAGREPEAAEPPARAGAAAPAAAPSPSSPNLSAAASFGLRTFVDCLHAESPRDGCKIALRALEVHRRQIEKESEVRHKARPAAARPGAPAGA